MGIMKKNAFTLAETLVTLAIIGMIASMLIPPLINSYQKTVNQVKLRKVYAILAQISQRAVAEYGDMSYIDFYDGSSEKVQEWYLTYFKPNLKIAKECFDDSGCWTEDVTHLNGDAVSNATARGIGGNIVTFKTIDGIMKIRGINKIDVIVGGPPCQAYSLVGRAQSSHMEVPMAEDPRNYLYKLYARF